MNVTTLLLLAFHTGIAHATIFPLFPRVGCFARFATFHFDINSFNKYTTKYFRNDSAMTLWQAGRYVGAEAIEEYVKFATPVNPFIAKYRQLHNSVKFDGYDRNTDQCKFLSLYHNKYEVDESSGRTGIEYTVTAMVKLFFDVKERYIPTINVYYTDEYVNFRFAFLSDTDELRAYVCNIYEGSTCSGILDPPDGDCVTALSALDQIGTGGRLDGNLIGCRILHSVLAESRNMHCPHISFEPMEDSEGKIKCQTEGNVTALDLFTQADLNAFAQYTSSRGLDPVKGHDWVGETRRRLA